MSTLTVAPVNLLIVKLFRWEASLSVHTPEMVVRASQGKQNACIILYSKFHEVVKSLVDIYLDALCTPLVDDHLLVFQSSVTILRALLTGSTPSHCS